MAIRDYILCPDCRHKANRCGRTHATTSGQTRRYKCDLCQVTHHTLEAIVKTETAKPNRRAVLTKLRGYDVPPEKEAEWRFLTTKKMLRRHEVAKILGLTPVDSNSHASSVAKISTVIR